MEDALLQLLSVNKNQQTDAYEQAVEYEVLIKDWHWPCYNSSVMRWHHGEHADIWDRFTPDIIDRPTESLKGLLPAGQINGGDQEWISQISAWDTFPADMFVSYRNAVSWPPETAKAVIFHGDPKPHEVTEGWVPGVWKVGGYTAMPELKGMNVTHDFAYANVRANVQRDLAWFSGFGDQDKACVIVGGGPSLSDSVQSIKDHRRRGAKIISVNNALRYLIKNGLTPDGHVMLDARKENLHMVEDAPMSVRYFLASQVHPCVFDALSGHDVVLWHNAMGSGEELMDIIKPIAANMPAVIAAAPNGLNKKFLAIAEASKAFLRTLTVLTIVPNAVMKAAILLIVKAASNTAAKDLTKTMLSFINCPILIKAWEVDSPKLIIFVCRVCYTKIVFFFFRSILNKV